MTLKTIMKHRNKIVYKMTFNNYTQRVESLKNDTEHNDTQHKGTQNDIK